MSKRTIASLMDLPGRVYVYLEDDKTAEGEIVTGKIKSLMIRKSFADAPAELFPSRLSEESFITGSDAGMQSAQRRRQRNVV